MQARLGKHRRGAFGVDVAYARGLVDQEAVRDVGMALKHERPPADVLDVGPLDGVVHAGERVVEQSHGVGRVTHQMGIARRLGESPYALLAWRGETRGALQGGRCHVRRSPAPRVQSNSLEHRGDRLVLTHRGLGEMPRPRLAAGDCGERCVRRASCRPGGAVVDRRAQQRMAKLHALRSDCQHSGFLGRVQDAPVEPRLGQRVEYRLHAFPTARGRQHQPSACPVGQTRLALKQRPNQSRAHGQRLVDRLLARELRIGEQAGDLEQRERVAVRAADEQLRDLRRRRPVRSVEHRPRRSRVEPLHRQRRQIDSGSGEDPARPCGDDHGDAFFSEPTRSEQKCVDRRGIEPLRIVNEHEH